MKWNHNIKMKSTWQPFTKLQSLAGDWVRRLCGDLFVLFPRFPFFFSLFCFWVLFWVFDFWFFGFFRPLFFCCFCPFSLSFRSWHPKSLEVSIIARPCAFWLGVLSVLFALGVEWWSVLKSLSPGLMTWCRLLFWLFNPPSIFDTKFFPYQPCCSLKFWLFFLFVFGFCLISVTNNLREL